MDADTLMADADAAMDQLDGADCLHESGDPLLPDPSRVSEREIEVLRLLAEGHANQSIAQELELGQETVKSHLKNLYRKLGARNRAEAVTLGFRHGFIA